MKGKVSAKTCKVQIPSRNAISSNCFYSLPHLACFAFTHLHKSSWSIHLFWDFCLLGTGSRETVGIGLVLHCFHLFAALLALLYIMCAQAQMAMYCGINVVNCMVMWCIQNRTGSLIIWVFNLVRFKTTDCFEWQVNQLVWKSKYLPTLFFFTSACSIKDSKSNGCDVNFTGQFDKVKEQKLWCIVVTLYVQFEKDIQEEVYPYKQHVCVYNHLHV